MARCRASPGRPDRAGRAPGRAGSGADGSCRSPATDPPRGPASSRATF
jgi:hypothetical protein